MLGQEQQGKILDLGSTVLCLDEGAAATKFVDQGNDVFPKGTQSLVSKRTKKVRVGQFVQYKPVLNYVGASKISRQKQTFF